MLKQHIQIGLDEPKATGFSLESLKLTSHSFDTYWPKLEESSIVAMILDPRYKLDIINNKDKKKEAKEKLGAIFSQYEEEKATREQDSTNTQASTSKNKSSIPAITKLKEKIIPLAQRFFTQSLDKSKLKPEVSIYLSEPRVNNFEEDILKWWKINQLRFPILSKMARDFLAAQASSVPSERGFSRSGLTVTSLRNSLHPETVQK